MKRNLEPKKLIEVGSDPAPYRTGTGSVTGFICSTCGITTTGKGHLCNPVRLERRTACRYHGEPKENPGQLCGPIAKKVRYVCASCGRLSPVPDFLCYPQRLSKAVKEATKKRAKAN